MERRNAIKKIRRRRRNKKLLNGLGGNWN